jgi:cytochrome c oxidase cbb3-type subunit III
MCFRFLKTSSAVSLIALLMPACQRTRPWNSPLAIGTNETRNRQSDLRAGPPSPQAPPTDATEHDDETALAEGKRMYGEFNCAGCHAAGGGAIGPPLMDAVWIYGGSVDNIVAAIVEGRPQGMPAFGGRIADAQIRQIAVYVKSLSKSESKPPSNQEEQVEAPGAIARGEAVFMQGPCALCHTIRGTRALSRIGPDLTHLASRKSIAGGAVPNTRGHLAGWILNPQNIKPGSNMPPTLLSGPNLQDLLSYLESLR